jgi:sugar/nucleoside kinase (ribokinase family)
MDLVTVGDLMVDVSVEAGALAHGGDVHGRVRVRAGGSAANAAVWAATAGARARVHGRVGDDLSGRLLAQALAERHVEAILVSDRRAPTGTMLVLHEEGERSMVADRGANERLSPDDLPDELDAGAVLVSGYTLLHEPTLPAAEAALERARARYVAVDAASWPLVEAFGAGRFFEVTSSANVLLANDREARALCGANGEDAVEELGQRYAVACVKFGERGAAMSWEGLLIRFSTEPADEVDPTGAGDAFDGTLLAHLVAGASPGDALRAACAAGAQVASSAALWPERRVG